jgi:hypothetical protein
MAELLQLTHSPVAAWLAWGLAFAFGLVGLGHAVIGLLWKWDDYRLHRSRARRLPG